MTATDGKVNHQLMGAVTQRVMRSMIMHRDICGPAMDELAVFMNAPDRERSDAELYIQRMLTQRVNSTPD